MAGKDFYREFFIYEAKFTDLNAGNTATENVNIQADSDFQIEKLTFFAHQDSAIDRASIVIPLVTVRIKDTGSGRDLSSEEIPVSAFFGSGEIPFILPKPRIVRARSTLAISATNVSSSVDYDALYLAFIGTKIYRNGG